MSKKYEQLKQEYVQGWKTWNNHSVLSYVHMPDGLALRLGIKDYSRNCLLDNVLIGQSMEAGAVTPYAHTYDGSYTELRLEWGENLLLVQTATDGDDLVVLVTPEKQPLVKKSSLLINGIVLWNKEGTVERDGEILYLKKHGQEIPVYMTGVHNGELFTNYITPYLSADLSDVIGISTGKRRSVEEIREILDRQKNRWQQNKAKYGSLEECYNAMQTCQAWDTIYNPQEEAPITTVSRIWNQNFGGYVLFCWDNYFGALMQSLDDKELAYCNVFEITNSLTPEGFVPNCACQNEIKTYDRSQPPVGSMVCLQIYERYQEQWFLQEVYDNLRTWNQWFMDHRLTPNGFLTWGSGSYEPKVGNWLEYSGVNDRQGAAYESGMDNSPMYDEIPYDKEKQILCLDDVGLTGLYINDCRCLAKIADILNDPETAQELRTRASVFEERMEELWDEKFGMYLNRRTDTGAFEYRLSPTHFYALYSSKVGQERAERMINEHMLNPEEFWGEYVLPTIARNDPSYTDNTYWRGRIWAPTNYLVYMAMREYDLTEARGQLAEKSRNLIMKNWLSEGHVYENYNADTGEGGDVTNSDPFYHWGGLLSWIALLEKGI